MPVHQAVRLLVVSVWRRGEGQGYRLEAIQVGKSSGVCSWRGKSQSRYCAGAAQEEGGRGGGRGERESESQRERERARERESAR